MKILITGGTGLIGKEVSRQLLAQGHQVVRLSRNPQKNAEGVPEFFWDLDRMEAASEAFEGVEGIINLAGAPIAKRWTPSYKSEILRSRADAIRLLLQEVERHQIALQTFVSASAVGYYADDLEALRQEDDPPGQDFLSLVCQKWEQEAQLFEALSVRTVILRIGIVLSGTGGALPQIAAPIRYGLGAPLGSGKQWMPWIHLQDVAAMFVHALEKSALQGVYNAVGPANVTNKELTEAVASVLKKPLWLPPVPGWALKLGLGEMAQTVLASNRASHQKIAQTGFSYRFTDLKEALEEALLSREPKPQTSA